MNNSNRILITILNWNDWKNSINCIKHLYKNTYKNFDLLVIDNGSKPYLFEKLITNIAKYKEYKFIKIGKNLIYKNNFFQKKIFCIRIQKNIGVTAAVNAGFKFAIKNRYKYVMRMDNDTELNKNCLKLLMNNFSDKQVAAVSPKILHWYRENVVWYQGFIKDWKYLKFHRTMNLKKKVFFNNSNNLSDIEVDAIAGAVSVYRVQKLERSGLGDEDFFYGPEDIELSFRLKKVGKLICNLQAIAYHKIAKSSVYDKNFKRIYYNLYGFLLLIKKIGNRNDKIIGYSFFFIKFLFNIIFNYKKYQIIKGYQMAFKKFFLGNKI